MGMCVPKITKQMGLQMSDVVHQGSCTQLHLEVEPVLSLYTVGENRFRNVKELFRPNDHFLFEKQFGFVCMEL